MTVCVCVSVCLVCVCVCRGAREEIVNTPGCCALMAKGKDVCVLERDYSTEISAPLPCSLLPQEKRARVYSILEALGKVWPVPLCHLSSCHTPSQSTGDWKALLPFSWAVSALDLTRMTMCPDR